MPRPPSVAPAFLALIVSAALALAGLGRPAAAFTPAEAKAPMTVTLVRGDAPGCGADCPEWLALTGQIAAGTPALFSAALARLGRRNVPVLVDSPGGSVEAAMAMGRAIRARKMTVAVAGTALDDCAPADRACAALRRAGERRGFVAGGVAACASACVLVLAAGVERSVGEHSFVGVHQIIVHQTLTRVMNYFRITRRLVNGRPVEVSRTLIETRPISSRQVTKAAPEAMYSEVDRYLLGLGIAEAIMPLMRATPPSGIHWMTRPEVAATRIATDTTDARVLVERSAPKAAPTPAVRMAVASLLMDGTRTEGVVTWQADGDALVGTIDVPGRQLKGTLAFRRDAAPDAGAAFTASERFPAPWTGEAPRFCEQGTCYSPFTVTSRDDGAGARDFDVFDRWNDLFLSYLRDRDRIVVDLRDGDGRRGFLTLPISGDARSVVDDWERRCCGLAPATTVASGTSRATLVSLSAPDNAPSPEDGTVTWHLDAGGAPSGSAKLVGDVDAPHFKGLIELTLTPSSANASTATALTVVLRGASDGRPAAIAAGPPGFRDARTGADLPVRASVAQGGTTSTMTIAAVERRAAVEGFRDRPWFAIPIRLEGRRPAVLLLNLNGNGRTAIDAWLAGEPRDDADAPAPAAAGGHQPARATAAAASWTVLHDGTSSPQPGGVNVLGSIDVADVGLRLSLQAGLAPLGGMGGVAVTLETVPDTARFGPVADVAVVPVPARDGGTALIGAAYRRRYGGFDVTLAAGAVLPPDAMLGLVLTDAQGRRLRIAVPLPGGLAYLLEMARRPAG